MQRKGKNWKGMEKRGGEVKKGDGLDTQDFYLGLARPLTGVSPCPGINWGISVPRPPGL